MERTSIIVGGFGVNCSILKLSKSVYIVDPGHEPDRIISKLEKLGLVPTAILLTHAHFDHIGAIPVLQSHFPNLPVYVHPNDRAIITHPMNQLPPEYPSIPMPQDCRDCRELKDIAVIETPGHTPGGVCYYFEADKLLLSGDTLFAGSAGRTDLPGGNLGQLTASLQRLANLPDDTIVIPGHGLQTTIGVEKRSNPFF